jgi:hypothetical protein
VTAALGDLLSGVPANVIANAIALIIGIAATRLWSKVANRRIWSLDDPSTLLIFVAEDSREFVSKGKANYVRSSTGVGQARALAVIAPSLRTAYREVDFGKVLMSGEGIGRDRRSDLITLGGAKNNLVTREIMNALSARYILPVPSPQEGLSWINEEGGRPKLYEADGGPTDGDLSRDDRIERDYGVIVKAPNPWNPKAAVIVLYGASTHGTAAAASYFVERNVSDRPEHFTALVAVDVTGGYNGEPTLLGLHPLQARKPHAQTIEAPKSGPLRAS